MMMSISEKLKHRKRELFFLGVILGVGIFLRTYHFHDWLEFRGDQVRDAYLVSDVVAGRTSWPLLGPFLSSGVTEEEAFHVGPIYYYFQIISAKLFGDSPDVLAYPDVLFAILSIPLLYLFLRSYFGKGLSLGLAGLYAISTYIIHYSRYAWSCNPIPFFALLLLLSAFRISERNEKTPWMWMISLGVAWGVGFQLHAITMVVFSILVFLLFLVSIRGSRPMWSGWALVVAVFIMLNLGQIIYEAQTGGANTKALLGFSSSKKHTDIATLIRNDIDCHIEANFLYLSSFGASFDRTNCGHDFSALITEGPSKPVKNLNGAINRAVLFVSPLFSIVGYFLFAYYWKREIDEKKGRFLRLVGVYVGLAFLVMLPLSSGKFDDLRYFSFVFFAPFVLLGFLAEFLFEKLPRKYAGIAVASIFSLLAISTLTALAPLAVKLSEQGATLARFPVFGELQPVADYLVVHADEQREVRLAGDPLLMSYAFGSLEYLAWKQDVSLVRMKQGIDDPAPPGGPVFFLSGKSADRDVSGYERIGQIYIHMLQN